MFKLIISTLTDCIKLIEQYHPLTSPNKVKYFSKVCGSFTKIGGYNRIKTNIQKGYIKDTGNNFGSDGLPTTWRTKKKKLPFWSKPIGAEYFSFPELFDDSF